MNLTKREFMQVLGAGVMAGLPMGSYAQKTAGDSEGLYEMQRFGQVSFLHMTDCHAQLLPVHFREPTMNLGLGSMKWQLPHLVGAELLKATGVKPDTAQAHALSALNFETAAKRYGKVGGFAHLATLVKRMKASRPGALLLDGGDTWQGSATSLWTKGQDMVDACKLLGVDVMTGHFEFTYGQERVTELVEKKLGDQTAFVAQNIKTKDFGDQVFKPYVIHEMNGVPCAIIGQAFPYTPIANPRYMVADWEFGIQEENLQKTILEARAKGAQVVVLLSHNGMDVDLKLASRVTGLDAILGGHTHDGMPVAKVVTNKSGQTLVTNAGSNGKFLGVLDLEVKNRQVTDFRYKLMPVFANLLPADAEMQALITRIRAPYLSELQKTLAITEGGLYRRGNFNGTGDQLLLDAMLDVQSAEIAFSPGFRWGTSLLPGQAITKEWLMDMTATTYSYATVTPMKGSMIKTILEDVADNLFNPDPYYQQGGDMVRVGGLKYTCRPMSAMGERIHNMVLNEKPIDPDKTYKVAGWAPVSEEASKQNLKPIWEVAEQWLATTGGKVSVRKANVPVLEGVLPNPGFISG
jgi:sulfur-oxidizing protein SoxB